MRMEGLKDVLDGSICWWRVFLCVNMEIVK